MKKIGIISIFILSFEFAFSQYEIDPQTPSLCVLVEAKNLGSGTGIYLEDSINTYFITAAHVIFNLQNGMPTCDSVFLITYREKSDSDNPDTLVLNLCDALKNGFAQVDFKNDIAIVKLARNKKIDSLYAGMIYYPHAIRIGKSTKINSWSIYNTKNIDSIHIGNDAFIFGYPKSLSLQFNFDFNRPLLRKGVIAGRDLKKNRIILDCPSYQGNSGGPAFCVSPTMQFLQYQMSLIGIVSQFIPFEEHWYNDKYSGVRNTQITNSGYTVLIPIQYALNLIPLLK